MHRLRQVGALAAWPILPRPPSGRLGCRRWPLLDVRLLAIGLLAIGVLVVGLSRRRPLLVLGVLPWRRPLLVLRMPLLVLRMPLLVLRLPRRRPIWLRARTLLRAVRPRLR